MNGIRTVRGNPTIISVLVPKDEIPLDRLDGIKSAAIRMLLQKAEEALPGKKLIIRDLTPQALELTNNEWTETSGSTDNAWNDTSIANKTIADNRFVAIIGCKVLSGHTTPPISALKFTVGGSEVARWDLYKAFRTYTLTTSGAVEHDNPVCYTEGPIIITQNMSLTISEYVIEASTPYKLAFFGYVCEPEGKTLKA
jgi:hypothetical protein